MFISIPPGISRTFVLKGDREGDLDFILPLEMLRWRWASWAKVGEDEGDCDCELDLEKWSGWGVVVTTDGMCLCEEDVCEYDNNGEPVSPVIPSPEKPRSDRCMADKSCSRLSPSSCVRR